MAFTPEEWARFDQLASLALQEDLDVRGDLTSQAVLPAEARGRAVLVARVPGILAGLPGAEHVFQKVDHQIQFQGHKPDGAPLQAGDTLASVEGPLRALLTAERTALNFLQRLSGIATLTRRFVDQIAGTRAVILDTRKTTPGWRLLEKYAVRQGGGTNHRMGLHDGILIKDNHLAGLAEYTSNKKREGSASPIQQAVQRARALPGPAVPLEIEVDNLDQFDEALAVRPDIILLDNMTLDDLREAVRRRDQARVPTLLEASGGVNLTTVQGIAHTGVDRISVGALTHSAVALDIGLDYQ